MIYDSLHILPKYIQILIYETGDISHLTDEKFFSYEKLLEVWQELDTKFNEKYNKFESNKVFNLSLNISALAGKYQLIKHSCDALMFDKNEEIIQLLSEYGYKVTHENYIKDIEKVSRESESIINKINHFKNLLPKPKPGETSNENSIIDVMSSYSAIVGYDFDYYTISVEKFHSIEKTVKKKMKNLEDQISKSKNKK